MKWSVLDFERGEMRQFNSKREAVKYFGEVLYSSASVGKVEFEYSLRYVTDDQIKDPTYTNREWLEVNCQNNSQFVYPTARVDADYIYKMIEYWHEQIAFGDFGSESVGFNFYDDKLQQGYGDFTDNKWLHENVKTWDELTEDGDLHDSCNHLEDLERESGVNIESMDQMTLEQESALEELYASCEECQIDQYIYDTGNGFYGARPIDRQTKRAYVLQINETESI